MGLVLFIPLNEPLTAVTDLTSTCHSEILQSVGQLYHMFTSQPLFFVFNNPLKTAQGQTVTLMSNVMRGSTCTSDL